MVKGSDKRGIWYLYAGWAAGIILCLISLNVPFFSDQETLISFPAALLSGNVAGTQAWTLPLPEFIDTGHPPLIQAYIGLCWWMAGATIPAAHLATLPILLLLITQFFLLAVKLLPGKWVGIALLMLFAQPTFLAHAVTISSEIYLLAFSLLCINALIGKKQVLFMIAASLLLLCSLRGIVVLATLGLFELYRLKPLKWQSFLHLALRYLLVSLPFIGWNAYHYYATGWMLSHEGSPWAEHRELASAPDFFQSLMIFSWRFIEFGMLLIWIPLFYALSKHRRTINEVALITRLLITMLALALIPFENPITNRYILLPAVLLILLALKEISSWKYSYLYAIICAVGLISAHFYIYPEKWSKRVGYAFDATLAYLPYSLQLRPKMEDYLERNSGIEAQDLVWSGFPEYHPYTWTDPTWTDTRIVQYQIDTQHIEIANYIVLSNMMNEIPYGTTVHIRKEWQQLIRFERGLIFIEVYKNPKAVKNG